MDLFSIAMMKKFGGGKLPFGEKTTTTMGDTLTWDGNTEGLVSIGGSMFKVSDTVLNYDDFATDGFSVETTWGQQSGDQSNLLFLQEYGVVASVGNFYSFPESAVGVDVSGGEGLIPTESGTYFTANMRSLTIPGYGKFETTETVITPIPTKYLPEALQFGEEEEMGDTLTWDGNTEGKVCVMDMYYKVSDATPSLEELEFAVITSNDGTVSEDGFSETAPNFLMHNRGSAMIALADGVEMEGIIFPEKGIYLYAMSDPDGYTESLTIPGYNGFITKTIKPMDEKYMPVLTSPNGTKYKISVADDGTISATAV